MKLGLAALIFPRNFYSGGFVSRNISVSHADSPYDTECTQEEIRNIVLVVANIAIFHRCQFVFVVFSRIPYVSNSIPKSPKERA